MLAKNTGTGQLRNRSWFTYRSVSVRPNGLNRWTRRTTPAHAHCVLTRPERHRPRLAGSKERWETPIAVGKLLRSQQLSLAPRVLVLTELRGSTVRRRMEAGTAVLRTAKGDVSLAGSGRADARSLVHVQ